MQKHRIETLNKNRVALEKMKFLCPRPDDARILLPRLDKKLDVDESRDPGFSTAVGCKMYSDASSAS